MKGVKHYKRDGTLHKGGSHKMPNGALHTNKTHTSKSKSKRRQKIMPKKKGLYANINARKKKGISRPKSKSTISKKAYKNMKAGFPKKKKKK